MKMKWMAFCGLLMLCCGSASAAPCLFGQQKPELFSVYSGAQRGQTAEFDLNPITGEKQLKLEWKGREPGPFELYFIKLNTPELNLSKGNQLVRVVVWQEAPQKGLRLLLRLRDASGEIIQISRPIYFNPAGKAGKAELFFPIDTDMKMETGGWGGNNDRKVELPDQANRWEFGLSRRDSGESQVCVFDAPAGFNRDAVAAACKLTTSREGTETRYDLTLPESAVGLTPDVMRRGFRFNLLVNDNDGEGRDGWIQIAPGIGGAKTATDYPFVVFESPAGGNSPRR